jgi:small subunit ribosomal protein S18
MFRKKSRLTKPAYTKPGKCPFCLIKTRPFYHETAALTRFINDRGKILSRTRTGVCAKHQRHLAIAVKRARHLALLPFINRV